jgi:hypothetical protein
MNCPSHLSQSNHPSNAGDSRFMRFHYLHFHTSMVLFQYYEEDQYHIRGQILKLITCVEPSPGLSLNVMQMISLASKNSGASLMATVIPFPFYVFSLYAEIRRNATQCISHLY